MMIAMDPEETTEHILSIMRKYGESDYIGEAVSQLEHSLQAAHLAAAASAGPETVLAALLHDIGQFLPAEEVLHLQATPATPLLQEMRPESARTDVPRSITTTTGAEAGAGAEKPDSGSVGRAGHDTLGAMYLSRHGFSAQVCALVGSHVAAKRYLCAVEPDYHDTVLSDASKASLKLQGGPMAPDEVLQWQRNPWAADMARLRKWDDAAKVPGLDVVSLNGYRDLMNAHLHTQQQNSITAVAA